MEWCKFCPHGRYQDEAGQTGCKVCPAGRKCDSMGMKEAGSVCPAGKFAVAGSRECETCPQMHFCPEGAAYPRACAAGTTAGKGASQCD